MTATSAAPGSAPTAAIGSVPQRSGTTRWSETDDLGPWAARWDELVVHSPLASPFLTTWWLRATGRRPWFVLVRDGDRLLGGLALERRPVTRRVDRFTVLGGGRLCPDHLDLVAERGHEAAVVAGVRAWFRAPGHRVVDLAGLREDALLIDALAPARVSHLDVAPYEPLAPGGVDGYYARRSKTFTQRIRKRQRRSTARGVTYRRASAEEAPQVLTALRDLHAARPERRSLLPYVPAIGRAVRAGLARGEVWLHVAEKDGRIGGVLICFTTGDRLRCYQLARSLEEDFKDAGTLLYAAAVEEACARGLVELDLLRGAEPYKASIAGRERRLLRLRASHGALGGVLLRLELAASSLRRRLGAMRRALLGLTSRKAGR